LFESKRLPDRINSYVSAATPIAKRQWISQHRLALFVVLAFVLSWYPWIIALARGRTSGPNPLGPFISAIIVTALAGGKVELRALLSRLVRVKVGWRWYAFVFGMPVLLCVLAAAVALAFTASPLVLLPTDKLRELPDRFIFILLFIGLGEEPGWRGFALPTLQKSYSPFVSSLILAPIWAVWHLPLFGHEFPMPIVAPFLVGLLGATLVQTWLFNHTRGSVLLQMLFHATVNTVGAGLIFPLFTGTALLVLWWIYAVVWLTLGVMLLRRFAASKPLLITAPLIASASTSA